MSWWAIFVATHGALGIFLLAFAESLFFPVPPDVLLVPLVLADPSGAARYALLTTVGSVLGGAAGYGLGYWGGRPLLRTVFSAAWVSGAEGFFARYGGWAVAIAGFTPIPYKVFTIAAGACKMRFGSFLVVSALSRGLRFAAVAYLAKALGPAAVSFLTGPFGWWTLAISLGVLLIWIWARRRR